MGKVAEMFGKNIVKAWNIVWKAALDFFLSSFFSQGSRSGLSLLLNVEQYEHMRGPQSDAGVKVNNIPYHTNKY